MRPLCIFFFALLGGGCAALLDFPGGEAEASASACADGVDGDLDGLTDCADPGCDPFCPEQSALDGRCGARAITCADGRDNDSDGLTDHHDPGCWPCATPTLARCASVAGVDDHAPRPDIGDWNVDGVRFEDSALRVAREAVRGRATMVRPLTGELEGLEITGEIYADDANLQVLCLYDARQGAGHFLPPCEQVSLGGGFSGVQLLVGEHGEVPLKAVLVTEDQARHDIDLDLATPGWRPFRIVVVDGRVVVELAGERFEVPAPVEWDPDVPIELAWGGWTFGGQRPGIRAVRARRAAHHPCGVSVPQMALPVHAIAPRSVASNGARLCALAARVPFGTRYFLGLAAFVSDDDGLSWAGRATRFPDTVDTDAVFSASVDWDPASARFRAVMSYERQGALVVLESADCVRWHHVADLPGPPEADSDNLVVAYSIDARRGAHRLAVIVERVEGSPLWLASSTAGPIEGLEWHALGATEGLRSASVARLQFVGSDLVLSRIGDRGESAIFVRGTDGWRHVSAWPLSPSGRRGTFDRAAVFPGVFLLPRRPGELTVFYAGDGDFSCWDPDDPCPCQGDCIGGVGTAQLTLGAGTD